MFEGRSRVKPPTHRRVKIESQLPDTAMNTVAGQTMKRSGIMKRLIVVVAILTMTGCWPRSSGDDKSQYFATADGTVELGFPAGWHKARGDNPYDLQCFSADEGMTTGVFQFAKTDLAEGAMSHKLLEQQVNDLRSKRENFKILEDEQVVRLEDKTLTTVVYSGEKDSSRYYYRFTLVEFTEKPEILLVVLQVSIPSSWVKDKPIHEEITKSARIRSEENPRRR